jgi:cathepsin B
MAPHSDDEVLDTLLENEETRRSFLGSSSQKCRILVVLAIVGALLTGWWGSAKVVSHGRSAPSLRFEKKVAERIALEPHVAVERSQQRVRLVVEKDLRALLLNHVPKRGLYFTEQAGEEGPDSCLQKAKLLFDEVAKEGAMEREFLEAELLAFKNRFASAMKDGCKDIHSEREWVEAAGRELEQQKPLMTAALAASVNDAGLGYTAKMQDWLLHESVSKFQSRLGLLSSEGQKDVLKREESARRASLSLPETFRAEQKWPQCAQAILRIHNQGACGSCWAFGAVASIDARMCIASNGTWNLPEDILSRLHVTSCAAELQGYTNYDGCQGGLEPWVYEMMGRGGIVSSRCLPYYIGGEGTEHFDHQDVAPPCETHCQNGYSLSMSDDIYSSAGVENYDWLTQVRGDPEKIMMTKMAIYQEGPVSFDFYANHEFMGYQSGVFSVCTGHEIGNHAVYAFGWGKDDDVDFIEALNSWGTDWGANGGFRIHPRCVTDVTIPGTIGAGIVNHRVGTVDPTVPRDENNEYWPWTKPDECPFVDGCVTDMEKNLTYSNNELCVSKKLNGKKIKVVEFDMEYGYDSLHINGARLTGREGRGFVPDTLNGVVVDDKGLRFASDFSMVGPGFKLCEA